MVKSTTKTADEKSKVIDVNSLKDVPRLGPVSRQRLEEHGITNMISLWAGMNNAQKIKEVTGIDKAYAEEALIFVRKALEDAGIISLGKQTADKLFDEILQRPHIKTSCRQINELLQGGFETSNVYEIFGHEGSGKTQMLHNLCINVTRPLADGGLQEEGKDSVYTLFIDTENTFRPDRILEMLEAQHKITQMPVEISKKKIEKKPLTAEESKEYNDTFRKQIEETKEFLKNHVIHAKSANAASLFLQLKEINSMISSGENIKLIIIDSLTQVFRGNYVGRGTMYSRTDDMKDIVKIIKDMAEIHRIVIVFNSQVYESVDAKLWEPDVKPYGGHILGHTAHHRLQLDIPSKNPKNKKRRMSIVKSNFLPYSEALYQITSEGVVDFDE